MTKYLLDGWRKALDNVIEQHSRPFKDLDDPEKEFRTVWFHCYGWVVKEIEDGQMLEEFKPFAESYMREHIVSQLRLYVHYRAPKVVVNFKG